jgi:hypothetical protein
MKGKNRQGNEWKGLKSVLFYQDTKNVTSLSEGNVTCFHGLKHNFI